MALEHARHLLLTGPPGCGKTTAIRRLIERLGGLRLAGFYTAEVRREGHRTGFEAVGLKTGRRTVLAHADSPSALRVGRYGVETQAFEELLGAEFAAAGEAPDLLIIDEIGRMECFSPRFVEIAGTLFSGSTPVLGSVALEGEGLIADVKERPDVGLLTVTAANREGLPEALLAWIRERLAGGGTFGELAGP